MKLKVIVLAWALGTTCANAGEVGSEAILAAHNKWRAKVGVKKLSYSPDLAKSAQTWADHLKRTNQCKMRHSTPEGRYGENLYWASAVVWSDGRRELQQVSSEKPVESWASEREHYNYASNSCVPGEMCGHYTQMVWRDSARVGCAVAVCEESQEQVWVCQYQPAGNIVGSKPY